MSAAQPTRGDVVRIRDERWTVIESTAHQTTTVITVVGCDRSNRGIRTRYLLPFEAFERVPPLTTTRVVSLRRWRRFARQTLAEATPSITSLRAAAAASVRILPYQLEPALAVTRGLAARILIADDVGLGKTIQAGLIAAEVLARSDEARVLIVCPASLRQQWRDELATRFHLTPVILDAASLQRFTLDDANPWSVCPLILTSVDYIKRPEVIRALEPLVWDLLVIDEAHGISGPSDRHSAADLLSQRARTVVMLTATPHSGSDLTFGRLAATGDLDARFPLLVFRRTRQVSGPTARRTRWLTVQPTPAERQMHDALMAYAQRVWRRSASPWAALAMILLTRRACSSALSLAWTVERRLALLGAAPLDHAQLALPLSATNDDDPETATELGAPGLDDLRDERQELETILALAHRAAGQESKVRALRRLLRRSGEPAIVFTEYRDTLATLDRVLAGSATCQLHGGLAAAERAGALERFASGASRILLATDAASEGLNLQHRCRLVIHLEVPWTPARIEQRVGRVDRIGQDRTVHQVFLVAGETVEESRVAGVVQRASRVAAAIRHFSHDIGEQQTAAYVIGGTPMPEERRIPDLPRGVVTLDLAEAASAEAERLRLARALRPDDGNVETPLPIRPFAAFSRRANRTGTVWALAVDYLDANGQPIWERLVGVAGNPPMTSRSAAHARDLMNAWWRRLCEQMAAAHGDPARHRQVVVDHVLLAMTREQAIAGAIEGRRARMASRLVQGALFDRRDERDATAQRELTRQALARCLARIAALERMRHATVTVRPVFALLTW